MRLAGERPSWNDLLERVFRVDGFVCPGCDGPLTLRRLVLNPRATRRDGAGDAPDVFNSRRTTRRVSDLMNAAYGLTDAKIAFVQETAPPRTDEQSLGRNAAGRPQAPDHPA